MQILLTEHMIRFGEPRGQGATRCREAEEEGFEGLRCTLSASALGLLAWSVALLAGLWIWG